MVDAGVDGGPLRFELLLDGDVVSYAPYRPHGDTIVVPHVETLAPHRGNGYADRLMAGIVEIVRERGQTILPLCWFASGYLGSRPECSDVIA